MRYILTLLSPIVVFFNNVSIAQNIPPEGFKALFNGKDLKGWFGHGTKDPRTLWKMSPEALKKHQEETLKDINAHWSVKDGELINDGKGLYLTTKKDYKDFELLLEYKTVPKADSGIYLRGVPQVQIWDPTEEAKWKIGADKGSGGLWNNSKGAPGKDPLKRMDKPFGEWNKFHIIMIGERVTVYLNNEKVVDNVVMENFFDRKIPIFEKGPIQLQTHGGEIRWKNIFIREITSDNDKGYQTLFNGKDLSGWHGAVNNYEVVDGSIMCKKGKGGTLYAKEEYGDFSFRFEFQLPPGGNNGIAVRSPGKGDPAWEAYEIQVLDDTAKKYAKLQPYQFHGSVYGLAPAQRGALLPVGEWNKQEITFKGSNIRVTLNETTILHQDISKIDLTKVKKVPKGVNRSKGFIGFAGHSDPVKFRNVRIKSL
ncbi:MAG: 3-keto-disaccharide hydrolase [Verrucomicrobiales bacterium]